MTAVRVTVSRTAGSVPREAGTAMLVRQETIEGTIGGGALEWEAMRIAREMLAQGQTALERTLPLGPGLRQCCGGSVTLAFTRAEDLPAPERTPLWIWGAGHVGRAIVATLAPLPHHALTLVDTAADRFPEADHGETRLIAVAPERLVPHAPRDAHHLILTYSHEIDLRLCHALLSHGFASCGLIGSATKWARFRSRLAALGHSNAQILRIACPIGDPMLGKHPQAIAVGVAAALLRSADRDHGDRTG
ncbi:xanthine dehydrogenase accessory protein XdhC [Roseisalinus antarcticus]|uniref:XdhC and CoxI family protein n=1 Tax=Roseisalinus antarcticus TaxID=254357 RepID=A0A1Y5SDB1_9RHOB|nr:xanthine dehydrogenase accessory protein XdhC [Roseisalinus antarcticus]SLN38091.1 XdhC and CoxI family protein [Roseisalinus antarcticus]